MTPDTLLGTVILSLLLLPSAFMVWSDFHTLRGRVRVQRHRRATKPGSRAIWP